MLFNKGQCVWRYLFGAVFLGGMLMANPANAQSQTYTVTVSGEAVRPVVPDKVMMSLTVQAEASKQVKAVELQGAKSQTVMSLLRSLGIPDKDVSNSGYTYGPVYDYIQGKNKLRGYQAVQTLTVKAPADRGGSLVDALSVVAEVNGISFFVSNVKELHEELVNSAIDDARARAERRANRLGVILGPIVGYEESSPDSVEPRPRMARAMAERADSAPELPAGETELRVTVSVTYRLAVE